ncbi:MAG: cystathionine gamma-synthase [Gammaproteobacteria bacterium]
MTSDITRSVHAGLGTDTQHGAVVPPLHLSSNFTFEDFDQPRPYDYTRSGNPTRDALGEALAQLEHGAGCVVTSSGMAAINLVCQLLRPGDLLIAPHDCYGGTFRLFDTLAARGAFRVEFVDQTDSTALAKALRHRPRLVWVETPSNPLLRLVDIQAVCAAAGEVDALVAVDNTFLSPALQNPLDLGADIVAHSTTKYLNGHSDVVGGAVIARDEKLHEELAWWANCTGTTGAPFDSFLTLRGVRTLGARIRAHEENALAVARALQKHPMVKQVNYPGLASHPDHELARRQQRGFGGMLSFELRGGEQEVRALLGRLKLFFVAESLGGVESLVCHPATMTHKAMHEQARADAGISDTLIRLSVGIESAGDLCEDLLQALDYAVVSVRRETVAAVA